LVAVGEGLHRFQRQSPASKIIFPSGPVPDCRDSFEFSGRPVRDETCRSGPRRKRTWRGCPRQFGLTHMTRSRRGTPKGGDLFGGAPHHPSRRFNQVTLVQIDPRRTGMARSGCSHIESRRHARHGPGLRSARSPSGRVRIRALGRASLPRAAAQRGDPRWLLGLGQSRASGAQCRRYAVYRWLNGAH